MNGNNKKTTRAIAFCSMLSALSVVFISLGMVLQTFDLVIAMFASYSVIISVSELGRGYAFAVFLSSALLAIIISPQNSAALFYSGFIGYYPIIKSIVEVKVRKKLSAIFLKFLCFNIALGLILFISVKIFFFDEFIGWYAVGLVVLSQIAFVLYDMVLTKIIIFYHRVLRRRLRIGRFLLR